MVVDWNTLDPQLRSFPQDPADHLHRQQRVGNKHAGERGTLWWEMCAVIVVMIIPVIFMAIFLQRFIAKGVLLGAVKG